MVDAPIVAALTPRQIGAMARSMGPLPRLFFTWHARAISAPRATRVASALARRIGRADSLLDVGAGNGATAFAVARATGAQRVAGVDVLLQPSAAIPITAYDGTTLPFPDASFEAVVLSDVLHHAADPLRVLRESLRVASRVVALKDHFAFGDTSRAILLAMDLAGNAASSVPSPGTYRSAAEWSALFAASSARVASIEWPLRIHDLPFRLVTRDDYQFAAAIVRETT